LTRGAGMGGSGIYILPVVAETGEIQLARHAYGEIGPVVAVGLVIALVQRSADMCGPLPHQ
jgi:hypothetical protein